MKSAQEKSKQPLLLVFIKLAILNESPTHKNELKKNKKEKPQ